MTSNQIPGKKNEDLIEQQGGNSLENCNERVSGLPTGSEWRTPTLSSWLILERTKKVTVREQTAFGIKNLVQTPQKVKDYETLS